MRRVFQRVNEKLGTNWTLHDLRHTAANRMANDPNLTLAQVRAILRHTDLATTGRYLNARVEDLFDALQAHYSRPGSSARSPLATTPRTSRRCSVADHSTVEVSTVRNRRQNYAEAPRVKAPTRFSRASAKAAPAPRPERPRRRLGTCRRSASRTCAT
ncbi:tyrosine-type recombinase/integrase [Streptomyces zhihengii]